MKTVDLKITGTSPLLMHSARLADPLDPATKALASITSIRKKTEETHRAAAKAEFTGGLYYNTVSGVHLPGINIFACIVQGARLSKNGVKVERGVMVAPDAYECPIVFADDKMTPEELFENGSYTSRMSVKVGQSRVMRTRPIFRDWALVASFTVDEDQINVEDFVTHAETAGRYVGLGDFRKGGGFGRFDVDLIS